MSTAARLQPPLALTLVRNQPGRRPRWTAQQDALLRAAYSQQTAADIAAQLGRSVHGVRWRARTLGLATGHCRLSRQERAEAEIKRLRAEIDRLRRGALDAAHAPAADARRLATLFAYRLSVIDADDGGHRAGRAGRQVAGRGWQGGGAGAGCGQDGTGGRTMLTRDDLIEIGTRYHREDWDGFEPTLAVFDIGRLMGHISGQAERIAALEAAARDALEGVTTIQEETSITPECEVCSLCGWGINHHDPMCSHAALAALLEDAHVGGS